MIEGQGDFTEMRLTGAELAMALAEAAADLDGPELGAVGERARGRLVDLAVAAERVVAWAAGVQARAVAGLHAQFLAEEDLDEDELAEHAQTNGPAGSAGGAARGSGRGRGLGEELAAFGRAGRATAACLSLGLGVSSWAADRMLGLALGLAEQPDLAQALAQGRVDVSQARVIHEATTALPPAARDRVVASLVTHPENPDPDGQETGSGPVLVRELRDGSVPVWLVPAHKLRPILARQIAAVAPGSVQDGEAVLARGRRVEYAAGTPARPGCLVLHGPEPDLAAVYDRLDTEARAARRCGAAQSLDQLRYDLALAALTGGALGLTLTPPGTASVGPPPRPGRGIRIDVVVAADTLLGVDDQPATLRTAAGDVPISAQAARRLAHDADATWRRILTDPATGTATDLSPGYAPAKRVADYVKVRDGHTSRFPTSAARTLELDHITAYDHATPARGGATSAANLATTGKRDHQDKTDQLITVTGNANHTLTYRTGAGHSYPSPPHQYTDPAPHRSHPPAQPPAHPPAQPPAHPPDPPPY
jgi:hypothetical protein